MTQRKIYKLYHNTIKLYYALNVFNNTDLTVIHKDDTFKGFLSFYKWYLFFNILYKIIETFDLILNKKFQWHVIIFFILSLELFKHKCHHHSLAFWLTAPVRAVPHALSHPTIQNVLAFITLIYFVHVNYPYLKYLLHKLIYYLHSLLCTFYNGSYFSCLYNNPHTYNVARCILGTLQLFEWGNEIMNG